MMQISPVHIAGIGCSVTVDGAVDKLALSAVVKALLDAGLTYSNVDHSVACFIDDQLRVPRSCFNSLGIQSGTISEVDNSSALFTTFQCVASGQRDCAMLVGLDKETSRQSAQYAAIAMVLVSDRFLTTHAYLKDSAIQIRSCALRNCIRSPSKGGQYDTQIVNATLQSALRQARLDSKDGQMVKAQQSRGSNIQRALSDSQSMQHGESFESVMPMVGTIGLAGLCAVVWRLRGWVQERSLSSVPLRNCLQYTLGLDGLAGVVILARSDRRAAPTWNEIEHLRDGRERLGYNPAAEVREVHHEDFEAVRARQGDRVEKVMIQPQFPIRGGDRHALARL